MLNRVSEDIKDAMKKKETERLNVVRYLKAMLIENKTSKAPRPEIDVVIAHNKKLQESYLAFPEGSEQRTQLQKEMEYLKPYLPEQMNEETVVALIKDIVAKLGATPQIGMVMKDLSPQIKGKFDGKTANE